MHVGTKQTVEDDTASSNTGDTNKNIYGTKKLHHEIDIFLKQTSLSKQSCFIFSHTALHFCHFTYRNTGKVIVQRLVQQYSFAALHDAHQRNVDRIIRPIKNVAPCGNGHHVGRHNAETELGWFKRHLKIRKIKDVQCKQVVTHKYSLEGNLVSLNLVCMKISLFLFFW